MNLPRKRWLHLLGVTAVLAMAAVLRIAPLRAALPYTAYVDEGYALSQVMDQLNTRSFQCRWYGYPTLTSFATTAAMRAVAPVYRAVHGHSFRDDLPRDRDRYLPLGLNYNLISPSELILVGRTVVAIFSIGTVVIAGLLARLVGGPSCALLAMLFTAVCPALVIRSSNVIVDSVATFFVVLSLYFATRMWQAVGPDASTFVSRYAALAGMAAGLALGSKYTAGAVFAAVAVTTVALPRPFRHKLLLLAAAGVAFASAALCANPSFIQHPEMILRDMRDTSVLYRTLETPRGYWSAALTSKEVGLPLVATAFAGTCAMLWRPSTRMIAISWLVFAVVLFAPLVGLRFQPFRNLLPLIPPLCVAAALLLSLQRVGLRGLRYISSIVALMISLSAGTSSVRQLHDRLARTDSRVLAVNWLSAHTKEADSILAIGELVVLPAEWKRVKARVTVVPWLDALKALEQERFDYLVGSEMNIREAIEPEWASHLQAWQQKVATLPVVAHFGQLPTPVYPYLWRTNDLRVLIWKSD